MIKRKIYNELKLSLDKKEITILTGARQVGKTTLIFQLKEELDKQGIPNLYFNADIFDDFEKLKNQSKFVHLLKFEFGDKRAVVFIDEIQRLENAGLYLKGIYDMKLPYKFIVTGSGSIELKSKISESLAGRKYTLRLHPVSFLEFLDYKTGYKYSGRLKDFLTFYNQEAFNYFYEYLSYGGLPRVITLSKEKEKFDYISEFVESFLLKDIYELIGVDRREILMKLLRLLAFEQGKIIKYSAISSDLGVSLPTVKSYLWDLEKTFIINQLTPFYRNIATELKKPTIVYYEDIGISNFLQRKFRLLSSEELSFNFQSFVFQVLRDYCERNRFYLHYWRTSTKAEIDFVIDTVSDLLPVEVKFSSLKKPTITRAIYSFIGKYQPKEVIIVNLSLNEAVNYKSTVIRFLSWDEFIKRFAD